MDNRAYASKILPRKNLVDLLEDWESVIYSNSVDDNVENGNKFDSKYYG